MTSPQTTTTHRRDHTIDVTTRPTDLQRIEQTALDCQISDEALEAAAAAATITWTLSINLFYCQFC